MRRSNLFISVALGLAFTLAALWALREMPGAAAAHNDPMSVPPTLTRLHDPVVIAGSDLTGLASHPLDEIFVYAYRDAALTQIPSQIDERNADGVYVAVEDGQLDDNDELVFMASDAGGWVDTPWLDAGARFILPTYVITLTDPINESYAWAYLFHSAALSPASTDDYVSYDANTDRISGLGGYTLGFDAAHGFPDYLTLSGGVDRLDRAKLRITGMLATFPFSVDEEDIALNAVHALDGPVRVTRVSTMTLTALGRSVTGKTALYAYRSLVVQMTPIIIPGTPAQTTYLRTSVDWNEQASGMVYYDVNNPGGIAVDGVPDVITVNPPTEWAQLASVTGTVVSISALPAGLGGTPSTYYKDDSTVDGTDTGDQRSFGDAGVQIQNPTPGIYSALGHIYVLTDTTTNVGSVFAGYYHHPLQMSVRPVPRAWHLYLPTMMRK